MDAPGLEEQVEAVRAARDHLARSAEWRAGRKGFNKARHARELAALDAAIATLEAQKAERDRVFRAVVLLGVTP